MRGITVRMGEKGQITVPVDLRLREKLEKGTQLEIVDIGEGAFFINKLDRKKELLLALRILGKSLKEKGYTKDKLIDFCRKIREEISDVQMSG